MEQHWILLDLADSSEGITQTVVSSRRIFEISFTSMFVEAKKRNKIIRNQPKKETCKNKVRWITSVCTKLPSEFSLFSISRAEEAIRKFLPDADTMKDWALTCPLQAKSSVILMHCTKQTLS